MFELYKKISPMPGMTALHGFGAFLSLKTADFLPLAVLKLSATLVKSARWYWA
jgi:hypothetical protein